MQMHISYVVDIYTSLVIEYIHLFDFENSLICI